MFLPSSTRVTSRLTVASPWSPRPIARARTSRLSVDVGGPCWHSKSARDLSVLRSRLACPRSNLSASRRDHNPARALGARQYNGYSHGGYAGPPDTSGNDRIVIILIAANAAVFAAWQYSKLGASRSGRTSNQRKLSKDMQEYFILSWRRIQDRNYVPIVASAFSHIGLAHFAFNMVSLYSFAGFLASMPFIRPNHLLILTFGSAVCGSVGFLAHVRYQDAQRSRSSYAVPEQAALGASGVVMGMGTAAAILAPRAQFLLMGVVPMPLWLLTAGYLVYDSWYLNDSSSRIGHSGHLGGMAFGALYSILRLRRLRTFYF